MRTIGLGTFTTTLAMRANVTAVLDSGRLSYGPFCQTFETQFAALHACRHAVLANSGTDALRVALHALKELNHWDDGDQVIVPAVTFVATVNVVLQNRLRPILVDVDPDYFHLDPTRLAAAITERTRAVIPVHLFGQAADLPIIGPLAQARDLALIEDSCEAMFVRAAGVPVGSWGAAGCFSTYMAHLVTTGVGGVITTNDAQMAAKCRSLVNHGRDGIYIAIDDDAPGPRQREVIARRFRFESSGYSARITELEAAIGLPQLACNARNAMLAARRRNADLLTAALLSFEDDLQLPTTRPGCEHAWMMYPLALRATSAYRKADLVAHLEAAGIETRDLLPILSQPCFKRMFPHPYPVARWLDACGFYLGCHQDLTAEDIAYIGQVFGTFFDGRPA